MLARDIRQVGLSQDIPHNFVLSLDIPSVFVFLRDILGYPFFRKYIVDKTGYPCL